MPTFTYSYVDAKGALCNNQIEGASAHDIEMALDSQGVTLIGIREITLLKQTSHKIPQFTFGKVTKRELIEFCIYLGTLSEAGLSLISALSEFASETQNEYFRSIILQIRTDIENGIYLSESLEKFPKVFSKEFIYLIKAGEQTGTLPKSLKELRSYLEWLERVNGDIKQATTYPLIISIALVVFVLYLFSFVVPKITAILIDMKVELPLITKIIITLSGFAVKTWWIWIIVGIITPLIIKIAKRKSEKFVCFLDKLKISLPIFGQLIRLILQARFSQNFSILQHAGISIINNLALCEGFIGNRLYALALRKASLGIQDGKMLSTMLKESGLFSGLVIRMIAVGEVSGDLENSLQHAASFYNEEVPRRVKRAFSVLEPLIILTLVSIIGTVALAIILPILSISQGLR